MISRILAHYRIVEKLGAGGMGEVYRATDTKLDRDVAIKVLPPAFAQDPERLARFQREAYVLASLNHPIIAAIRTRPTLGSRGKIYRNEDEQIAVVDYKSTGGSLVFSKPRAWSDRRIAAAPNLRNFTLAPDGKRFAVVVSNEGPDLRRNNEMVFLENFSAELRRRVN